MKRWLRFTAAVLAAAFLFALTGCGSSTNSASFTWFVDSIPANLDPQVASGASDVIACENLYGTLVRKDPDGELVPGLCEKWTVSPDGLTYTFTLKDGLTYAAAKGAATEYDITAEDFVFAFRRIFRADTASPYAVEFSAIQNSAAVQAGLADESSLGVSANGALTLVFRLSERDDNFLAKLALPGAAPCDEAFFESTRGTYGLTAKTTLASGSFYLYNWTTNGLFLRRTVESPLVGSLRLVQDTSGSGKSAAQLIADDKCSAALDESGEATSLQTVSYSDTTWALLFNAAEGSVFQNQQLRQALAGIARENAAINQIFSDRFTAVTGDVIGDRAMMESLKGHYDVVLANIVADVIIPLSRVVPEFLQEDSIFICSGILNTRLDEVLAALEKNGLQILSSEQQEDWCRVTAALLEA